MRIKQILLKDYKRFTELEITNIPETARLVILAGPNGCGKSSLFDAFHNWRSAYGGFAFGWDKTYHVKQGTLNPDDWSQRNIRPLAD